MAGGDALLAENVPLTLDASASVDPDQETEYEWDFSWLCEATTPATGDCLTADGARLRAFAGLAGGAGGYHVARRGRTGRPNGRVSRSPRKGSGRASVTTTVAVVSAAPDAAGVPPEGVQRFAVPEEGAVNQASSRPASVSAAVVSRKLRRRASRCAGPPRARPTGGARAGGGRGRRRFAASTSGSARRSGRRRFSSARRRATSSRSRRRTRASTASSTATSYAPQAYAAGRQQPPAGLPPNAAGDLLFKRTAVPYGVTTRPLPTGATPRASSAAPALNSFVRGGGRPPPPPGGLDAEGGAAVVAVRVRVAGQGVRRLRGALQVKARLVLAGAAPRRRMRLARYAAVRWRRRGILLLPSTAGLDASAACCAHRSELKVRRAEGDACARCSSAARCGRR